jgi:hypothetical protein
MNNDRDEARLTFLISLLFSSVPICKSETNEVILLFGLVVSCCC